MLFYASFSTVLFIQMTLSCSVHHFIYYELRFTYHTLLSPLSSNLSQCHGIIYFMTLHPNIHEQFLKRKYAINLTDNKNIDEAYQETRKEVFTIS